MGNILTADASGSNPAPAPPTADSWSRAVVGNLLVRLCGLAAGVVVARALGPTGRGIIAAAIIWPNVVLSVGAIVNTQTVTYFSARFGRRGLQTCLALSLGCAVFVLVASLITNRLALGLSQRASLRAADGYALSIPFSLLAGVFAAALLAEGRVGAYWASKIFTALATAVPVFVLAVFHVLSIRTYIISTIVAAAAGVVVTAMMQRTSPIVLKLPDLPLARSVLSFGARTTLTLLPYQLNLRLDQLVISMIAPARVLGPYAVAFAWASTLSMVGSGFSSVILSRSTQLDSSDPGQVAAAARTLRLAFLVFVCCGIGAAVCAPIAIPILFGPDYTAAIIPGVILCLASIPLYSNLILHEFLRGIGLPGIGGIPEALGLAVSALGLAFLFPRYGTTGAAVVSLLSYSTVLMALTRQLLRHAPNFAPQHLMLSLKDVAELRQLLHREWSRRTATMVRARQ